MHSGTPSSADHATRRPDVRVSDGVLIAIILAFVGWVAVEPANPAVNVVLDYGTLSFIGVMVAWLQHQAARASDSSRERIAWRLLSLASAVRVGSGIIWSVWIADHAGESRPLWLLAISAASLALGLLGLVAFGSEPRRDVDRRRQLIDAVIVLVGILTSLWFAALGPFFAATGAQEPRLEDYVYLLADSTSVILAALFVLSRSQRYLRRVASLLLVAAMLQTVPDVLLWAGKTNYSYRPGDGIAIVWFSVWVLKAAAARYAVHVLRHPTEEAVSVRRHYESGAVPTAFVILASIVLVVQLTTAPQQSKLPLVLSVSVLVLLLVVRQVIELREQVRVQHEQDEQAQWYGAVLRDSNDYVMVLDADGNSLDVSPAARRLVHTSGGQSPWALLSLVHPDDQLAFRQAIAAARDRQVSLAIRVPDDVPGQWRQLALTIVDRRHDEEAGAVLLHAHDITRATQLSDRLRQTEEMEALGVFAGGLAHDLNNILTVVDAHAGMLEEDLHDNEIVQQDVMAIRHASERARRFTRGLLALSRHKQGRETTIPVEPMIRQRIALAGLTEVVSLECEDELDPLYMDQSACQLAVDSLLLAVLEAEPLVHRLPEMALQVMEVELTRQHADTYSIEPGRYLRLVLIGLYDAMGSEAGSLAWDGSASQLALLLANAAAREVGGIQRVLDDGAVYTWFPLGVRE